jgi:hypothetical protein
MPLKFWDEAFLTAVYLINRLPSKVIHSQTPMERLFGHKGDYSFLRVFGCACWPNLRPYNKHKLQFRSKQCAFLGYSSLHKGYKCLDISTGRVYISRDIVFDESVFPFAALHSNAGARLRAEINLLPLTLQPLHLHDNQGHVLQNPPDANPTNTAAAESFVQDSHEITVQAEDSAVFGPGTDPRADSGVSSGAQSLPADSGARSSSGLPPPARSPAPVSVSGALSPSHVARAAVPTASGADAGSAPPRFSAAPADSSGSSAPDHTASPATGSSVAESADAVSASLSPAGSSVEPAPVSSPVRLRTRLQSGIVKPKEYTDGTVRYDRVKYGNFCSTGEPSSTTEALADTRWKEAMDEEYSALMQNRTWHLVPSAPGQNVIDCKWVYKVKRKADGTVDRYKARLVAKGFKQ